MLNMITLTLTLIYKEKEFKEKEIDEKLAFSTRNVQGLASCDH